MLTVFPVRTIPLGSFYAQLYHKEYQVLLMRILTSNKDTDEPIEGLTIVLPYPGESIVAKLELFNVCHPRLLTMACMLNLD
jgi:hypothetical protein